MKRVNFLLNEKLYKRLAASAFFCKRTMSEFIREAIERMLTGKEENSSFCQEGRRTS